MFDFWNLHLSKEIDNPASCNLLKSSSTTLMCSSSVSGVNCQQQFFRVKPKDAEVGQGGVAVIACEVANRRGRVQWTKDGLTLGKTQKHNIYLLTYMGVFGLFDLFDLARQILKIHE